MVIRNQRQHSFAGADPSKSRASPPSLLAQRKTEAGKEHSLTLRAATVALKPPYCRPMNRHFNQKPDHS